MRTLPTIRVLAAAVLAGACATDTPDAPARSAVRDSAGITIVENTGPAWTEPTRWRLSDAPVLQIGAGVDGDSLLLFANPVGVHRLNNGVIAVVDSWAAAVSFFDESGELLGRVGRRGTGPGEFPERTGSITGSFACGADTVYVLVEQNIAAYVPPGEYARTFQLSEWARIRGCSGERILGEMWHGGWRTEPGMFMDSSRLAFFGLDGKLTTVFDTVPGEDRSWVRGAEGVGYSTAIFGRHLSVAGAGNVVATGFGTSFEVHLRDVTTGSVARIIRIAGRERTVSAADVEAFRNYVMNPHRGNEQERRRKEEQLAEAEGRGLPAFAELRFDRAGNLWARNYDHIDAVAFYDYSNYSPSTNRPTVDQPRVWVVIAPDGRYLGEVAMPADFRVHEIGDDWVLGIGRDELDIPYVRQYALIKP